MSILSEFAEKNPGLVTEDLDWLHSLIGDWQMIADMALADLILWLPTNDGQYEAVAHARPSGSPTAFAHDLIGHRAREEWASLIDQTYVQGVGHVSKNPDWTQHSPTRLRAVPVRRAIRKEGDHIETTAPIAVVTRHTNVAESRTPSRQDLVFLGCASDLLDMIAVGDFPDLSAPTGPRRGAPRVSDGLIRLDRVGEVLFASPNAISAYNRLGFDGEIEGRNLSDVTVTLVTGESIADESLPVVTSGKASWRADVEGNGATITLRAIPLRRNHHRIGAIVLCRDVSEVRRQEQELLTKDATIREIHHRVKNNLQTVSSLLRIQSRRTQTEEARAALLKAMRRVEAIAVVHDTLSEGLSQSVDFDEVFERVLRLITEVASVDTGKVYPTFSGSFGELPSASATPLALALTELVTNAVEHGLNGADGQVWVKADRDEQELRIIVGDDGGGLPEGKVGSGLGTQIVRTLIEGELSGAIDWHTLTGSGTEVTITIPVRSLRSHG
ncbi:sensor histidine kinase [Pseudoclavibacter sp. CFCC 13611]|uniref:sensor histidine kinase n=1 Tax=Pseudoclavibacter sp. CFCC 13611 TaxID=2615178 RepID=UPI00130114FB|nr:sensor histidine kinase [Pseudoclavibacter sp. CFCC 13611]KAB1663201.1 ATPase [Pseudoclavibacter sp. CFCC 13611]